VGTPPPPSWLRVGLEPLREISGRSLRPLAWSLATSLVAQGALFATNFGLARILGRSPFGEWAALQSTINTVAGIAQLSMAITATKYVAQYRSTRPDRVGAILGLCGLVTMLTGGFAFAGVLLASEHLAGAVLGAPHLAGAIRLSAVGVLLMTLGGYQVGALAGLERFRASAVLAAGNGLLGLALVLAGASMGEVRGAIAGFVATQLLSWASHRYVLGVALAEAGITVDRAGARREAAEVASFAFPATLSGIAGTLGLWGSTVALVRGAHGYSAMALFAVASTFRGIVLFPPSVVQRVSAAVLTGMSGRGEHERYRRGLASNVLLALAGAGAAAAPIALLAPWLLAIFGDTYREGTWVVVLLVASGVLEAMTTALGQEFVTSGRMWANLAVFAARAALLVVGTVVLAPTLGAAGAAWATLGAHGIGLLLSVVLFRPQPSR